jgi:hypothetical protein
VVVVVAAPAAVVAAVAAVVVDAAAAAVVCLWWWWWCKKSELCRLQYKENCVNTVHLHGLRLHCILTQFGIIPQLSSFYILDSGRGTTFVLLPTGISQHILIYIHNFINPATFPCCSLCAGHLRDFMLNVLIWVKNYITLQLIVI